MTTPHDDITRTPRNEGPQTIKDDHDLLVRIYERQRAENERIDQISQSQAHGFAKIDARFDALDSRYVTLEAFWPVKTIVYAGAGIVLAAVLTALVAMVVINREAIKAVRAAQPEHTDIASIGR